MKVGEGEGERGDEGETSFNSLSNTYSDLPLMPQTTCFLPGTAVENFPAEALRVLRLPSARSSAVTGCQEASDSGGTRTPPVSANIPRRKVTFEALRQFRRH